MYCLNNICCICLCKENLQNLSVSNSEEITHYDKLISCIPEMCYIEMTDKRLSCTECFNAIDTLYKFRQKCLYSKSILIDYFSKQHFADLNKLNEIYVKKEFENQEIVDFQSDLESSIKNINEAESFRECESDVTDVNLIKTEPNIIELESLQMNMKENEDDLTVEFDEMEQDSLQESFDDPLEMRNFNPNFDMKVIHKAAERKKKRTSCVVDYSKIKQISHISTDMGIKTYECTVCKRKFIDSSKLSRHMRIHTGEKPYECTLCEKKFNQSSTLTRHMNVHTREKSYECTVCQKIFKDSSTVTKHMRIHTGEKNYKCSICKKKFTRATNLTRHIKVHT